MTDPSSKVRKTLRSILDSFDPKVVGPMYCTEGGEAFWTERRDAVRKGGEAWGRELLRLLPHGGRSLYFGAGVAELGGMLTERIDLGRAVQGCTLRAEEAELLTQAFHDHDVDIVVEARDVRDAANDGPFTHISAVSVFTDPEFWPEVCGVTYGRLPPPLLDVGAFERERSEIRAICQAVGEPLARPGLITTTVEEAAWWLDWVDRNDLVAAADDATVDAAVVGDPIGWLSISGA